MQKPARKQLKSRPPKTSGDSNLFQKALLFLLLLGGLTYLLSGGNEQQQDIQLAVEENALHRELAPELQNLRVQYVAGIGASRAMVISGRIHNPSEQAVVKISLKARLFRNGSIIREIETYVGRMLDFSKLEQLSTHEINNYLNSPYKNDDNASPGNLIMLKPGASMPFMVVFSNVQDQGRDYKLDIINWQLISGSVI